MGEKEGAITLQPVEDVLVLPGAAQRDPNRTRVVHKSASVGPSSLIAILGGLGVDVVSHIDAMTPAHHRIQPPRIQTPGDLERLAQAEAKRQRKALKRNKP